MENKDNKDLIEEIIKCKNDIYKFSLKLFKGNKELAEDLTHDVIYKAIIYSSNIKNQDNIKGLLFVITKNTFINQYRKKIKFNVKPIIDINNPDNNIDILDNSSFFATTEDNSVAILKIISQLDDKYKNCIQLSSNGFKIEEIAMMLNIPAGTVKSRIFFARKIIKEKLKPIYNQLDLFV